MIGLIDAEKYPFKEKPPTYIRSRLYHYDFTRYNFSWHAHFGSATEIIGADDKAAWWHRSQNSEEYTPTLNKRNPSVNDFLNSNGWQRPSKKEKNILQRCKRLKLQKHAYLLNMTNRNLCDLTIILKKQKFSFHSMLIAASSVFVARIVAVTLW